MSPDIPIAGDDRHIACLLRERVLGGGIAFSALLWGGVVVVTSLSDSIGGTLISLVAAASTVSLFCALLVVGFGTRRIIIAELARLAAEVEQLNAKFDNREAAWATINQLTDGALGGGTLSSLRRRQ